VARRKRSTQPTAWGWRDGAGGRSASGTVLSPGSDRAPCRAAAYNVVCSADVAWLFPAAAGRRRVRVIARQLTARTWDAAPQARHWWCWQG